MLIKIAVLFLAVMLALALWSGFYRSRRARQKFCPDCGRPRIGSGDCQCRRRR